jgi:hypothetical protein
MRQFRRPPAITNHARQPAILPAQHRTYSPHPMPRRALVGLLVTLAAGVLVGSGLAGLSSPLPNDACSDFGSLPEGSTSGGSMDLWPLGQDCEYHVGSRLTRTTHFGPTTAELYAWILAAALLTAIALRRRDSALVRGTAAAALMLALAGAGWHLAGVQLAFSAPMLFGVPVACAVDHRLRPRGTRAVGRSLLLAVMLWPLTFCAIFGVLVSPLAGIAFGLAAGALASVALERAPGSPRARSVAT